MTPYSIKLSSETRSHLKQVAESSNMTQHATAKLAIEEFLKTKNPLAA